jgi:outer membrane protein assembly factor BamB
VGETVVALGAQGVLVAADRASGREIWRTDLRKDHAGQLMRGNVLGFDWGYSESPLVEAGRVVVSPGGPKGTVAAFDLITGKLVWRTTKLTDAASYSSAVAADIHGVRQLVQLTGGVEYSIGAAMKVKPRAVGLSPADGAVLWECPIHYTTAGVINTPVVRGNTVYATCGYSAGCTIVRVEKSAAGFKVTDATSKDARRAMPVYHGGVVPVGDSVIGYSETAGWVCQRLPKGETVWEVKRGVTGGAAVLVGGMLVIVTVEGGVALTEPGEDGWTLRGEFVLPRVSPIRKANGKIRVCTHPVVADGRLYARDQGTLYCFDLRKTTSAR